MRHEDDEGNIVVVDLLCGGESPADQPSLVVPRIADHVELAFMDSMSVELKGPSTAGTDVTASRNICGPGAFVLSKASNFASSRKRGRLRPIFVLQYFASGPTSVFTHLAPFLRCDAGQRALQNLENEFMDQDADGPDR